MDLDPEPRRSMSGSYICSLGMKINQSHKKIITILTTITVLALLSTWNWENRIVSTEPEYKKTNSSFIKNFYCAEYDPLMPTEDDVTDTSDAEAMRILEEEDESDPAAGASAAADADPNSTENERDAPASASGSDPKRNISGDTMDTTDPSKARLDPEPAPGSVIFKTPEAPPAKAPGKSGPSGYEPPPELPPHLHGSGTGSGPGSGSGSSTRSSSSSESEYSSAFSSCERNELPPLYYTVKKARASSLAPRVLGQGPDNNFFDKFGDFASDNRHIFASHRHSFEKKKKHQHLIQPNRHALQHM